MKIIRRPSNVPIVVATIVVLCFVGAMYYVIAAGKDVVRSIEVIAAEAPQVYIVPRQHVILDGGEGAFVGSPATTFDKLLFRIPWEGMPTETKGLRGITFIYPSGRSITVVKKDAEDPRTAIQTVLRDDAPAAITRLTSAYGPDVLNDPFLFMQTVLSTSPDDITFLTLESRAETKKFLLVMKENAAMLNDDIYEFQTRYIRGFQFGMEDDTIIAVDLFKRDGSAYSFLLKGVTQKEIDLLLGSVR